MIDLRNWCNGNWMILAVLLAICCLTDTQSLFGQDQPAAKKLLVDQVGDPLPPGAIARLGTVRFRRSERAAYSPDGKSLVTKGYNTLWVWDVKTGKELRHFESKGNCFAIAVSPDGNQAAISREAGNEIDVQDLASGKIIHHFKIPGKKGYHGHTTHSLVFSKDGKTLFTSDDFNGYVWDLVAGKQKSSFPHMGEEDKGVWMVMFSADGKYLATGTQSSKVVDVWEAATGKRVREIIVSGKGVECAAFSPKGDFLATGGHRMPVEIWVVTTGERVHTLGDRESRVFSLAFSPDGALTAADRDKIVRWNVAEGEGKVVRIDSAPQARRVHYSFDGKTLAWETGESVSLLDAATGKELHSFAAHTSAVNAVACSSDGKLIATGSEDGDVRIWDATTHAEFKTLKGQSESVYSVAFSPDSKSLASCNGDDTAILWDVATGKEKWKLERLGNRATSITFSPDGKRVALAVWTGEVIICNTETGERSHVFNPEVSSPHAVVFFPDGNFLASAGGQSVSIWDLNEKKLTKSFKLVDKDILTSLAVSGDGRFLAASGATTYVWQIKDWKQVATLPGMHNFKCGLAFSPDSKHLAFASDGLWGTEENNVRIWETESWKDAARLKFPLQRYTSVAFSPDGKHLVTGSEHAEALIWDLQVKE